MTASVDTAHGHNAPGWHPATGGVERTIRQLIIGVSHLESARGSPRSRRGMLSIIMEPLKTTPCLLVRHKYRHTNHHAAASLSFKFVPAPVGAAHGTNTTRHTTRITAPSCTSYTRRTRGTGRALAYESYGTRRASYFGSSSSRRRRRGPWGVLELPEIQQPPEHEARLPATRPLVI